MAVKKAGLGRGLDSMFPDYRSKKQAAKTNDNTEKENVSRETLKEQPAKEPKAVKAGKDLEKQPKENKVESEASKNTKSAVPAGAEKDKDVILVKTSMVEPNREQPRKHFDEDSLIELADSIKQYGVISPILVKQRDDYYEIIAGERRWRAAKLAGLKKVPVIVRELTDREVVEISLIENIQREDLNPVEEAKAYQRLLEEFSLKQDEIAARVSKSRTTITNSLRLLKLNEKVQEMLVDGMISAGHARALLAIEDPELQRQAADQVFDEKMRVRDTEKLVKTLLNRKTKPKPVKTSPALQYIYQDMEDKMKAILGTKVTVNHKAGNKGRIEIEYYSQDELERIYDLLRQLGTTGDYIE